MSEASARLQLHRNEGYATDKPDTEGRQRNLGPTAQQTLTSQGTPLERNQPTEIGSAVTTTLRSLSVISNQADVRIRKAKAEFRNAMRYGDRNRQINAEAQLDRALKAIGR